MEYLNKILGQIKVDSRDLKVFLINFVVIFVMVFIQHLHIRLPSPLPSFSALVSPVSVDKIDPFEEVKSKLFQKDADFRLRRPQTLLPAAQAANPDWVGAGQEMERLSSYAVVDFDSGQVLLEKEMDRRVPPASLTKIMSAVVSLDLVSPDEQFPVTEAAQQLEPTTIGVVAGQKMNVGELLAASLITSANDAIQVIVDGIDQRYGQGTFVKAMNEKARFLGLANSYFANPQGFDSDSAYSSASDLVVLSHYALTKYPLIARIVKTDYQFLPASPSHKQFDLYNWNGLLGVYPGAFGIKIGNTGKAGYTTAVVAQRQGKKVLVVVLGAPGVLERDLSAARLLDQGFQKEWGLEPVNVNKRQLEEKYSTWRYFW